MSAEALHVVYVVSKWNQETETFVRREVAAALEAGSEIQVVSLQQPAVSDGIVDDNRIRVVVPTVAGFVRWIVPTVVRSSGPLFSGLFRLLRLGRRATWMPHLRAWAAAVAVAPQLAEADVVLAHFAWLSSTTSDNIARLRGWPYAIFVHAHGVYEKRCHDRYLTDRLRRASVVFVESDLIGADVHEWHGVDPVVMRMGVPEEFVVEEPQHRAFGDMPLVVSVGALREKKGHDLLIRAVAERESVQLRIAGEGPKRAELESLIEQLQVGDRVQLLGHRSLGEVRELLDKATVFCLASRLTESGDRDGVPNVLIEAMARGVPVVATSVSGIPDLLSGGCGVLVEPDRVAALTMALDDLLVDPELGHSVATAALARIRRSFTTSVNWQAIETKLR